MTVYWRVLGVGFRFVRKKICHCTKIANEKEEKQKKRLEKETALEPLFAVLCLFIQKLKSD